MATQKVCDGCGVVGDEAEVSRRALLVSKNEAGTVHIHMDVSADTEMCNECMKKALGKLIEVMDYGKEGHRSSGTDIYASRVQPK